MRPTETVLAAAAAVWLAAGCSNRVPDTAAPEPAPADPNLVILSADAVQKGRIEVVEARRGALPEVLQVPAQITVDENRTSRVGSIADGRVVSVHANAGDFVKEGQRLVAIHSHEVHEARADGAKARAELSRRRAELQYARNARDRAAKLFELKAGSLESVQRADADLQQAEMAVAAAEAELARHREHLHYLGLPPEPAGGEELLAVVAPISGIVLRRNVSPGTVVDPSSDMFVISDLSRVWAIAQAPERHLGAMEVGRPVRLTVQAYPGEVFPARIGRIGDELDPDTRTAQVRCEAANPGLRLKPEMYATVTFDLSREGEATLIPTAAIQTVNGDSVVFVREDERRFRARRIRAGRQADSQTEVLEGLKPGEKIVTSGSFLLKSELLKSQMAEE